MTPSEQTYGSALAKLLTSEREANIYRRALRDIADAKPRWWRAWSIAREALRAGLECRS